MGFEGKVALIGGGGGNIGAATAELLAGAGARVVVGDVSGDAAEGVAARLRASGAAATACAYDATDETSVAALVAASAEAYGGVDLLVNAAADLSPETLRADSNVVDAPAEVWDRALAVNLQGYALLCRAVVPRMLERGGGAIVNVSSGAAVMGERTRPAYAASKAGVEALTRHIASRWGRQGVRCNAVAPGVTLGAAVRAAMDAQLLARLADPNPTGRVGEPMDIARPIVFLLSDDASWVNGQVLAVDGGMTMR
jgi:NAD(P)-dependent dehydrogenase (short-subunit alcohol dehydrogenase family)